MKHPELRAGHPVGGIIRVRPFARTLPVRKLPCREDPLAADTRQAGPGWTTLTVSRWIGLRHASEV